MSKKRKTHQSQLDYQSLEPRKVLAPVVGLDAGIVSIEGTNLADFVHVKQSETTLYVEVNNDDLTEIVVHEFNLQDVLSLYFKGNSGDDTFRNDTGLESLAYGNNGNDLLIGGSGYDKLHGGNDNDTLRGRGGDDSLHGDYGDDLLAGGSGDDNLRGWYGNDRLYGQDGNDYVSGYLGDDILHGGNGDDVVKGHEGDDRIFGGDGSDELYGWLGNDRLLGGNGDDYVSGYHGNDFIAGNRGDDVLKGHEGNDRLFGGAGDDAIYAWVGNDRLNGGAGNDELWGGDGNDRLVGWTGDDILHGDKGNDRLFGNDGNDILFGFLGSDRLFGGHGNDLLCGGFGNDAYLDIEEGDQGYDPENNFTSSGANEDDAVLSQEDYDEFVEAVAELLELAQLDAVEVDNFDDSVDVVVDVADSTKLYITDSRGRLSTFDTETREYEYVGDLGVRLTDIAMNAEGELYGVSFNSLYKVNTETAQTVYVGDLGRGDVNALTFTEDGTLLAAGFSGSHVYSVNVDTAQLTSIGTFSGQSAGDLSFHDGELFVSTRAGQLLSLDVNDAGFVESSTHVGNVSTETFGLASQNDEFFAAAGSNLFEVDEQDGSLELVANLFQVGVFQIWGLSEGV